MKRVNINYQKLQKILNYLDSGECTNPATNIFYNLDEYQKYTQELMEVLEDCVGKAFDKIRQ